MIEQTTTTARACRHCGATTDLALRGLGVLDERYHECREGCPTPAAAPLDLAAIAALAGIHAASGEQDGGESR